MLNIIPKPYTYNNMKTGIKPSIFNILLSSIIMIHDLEQNNI